MSRMRKLTTDLLRISDAFACTLTTVPSTTRYSKAGLKVLAARTFQKNEVIESYFRTLICHTLSSRKHKRTMYGDGDMNEDVLRFCRYEIQVQLQRDDLRGLPTCLITKHRYERPRLFFYVSVYELLLLRQKKSSVQSIQEKPAGEPFFTEFRTLAERYMNRGFSGRSV